MTPHWKYIIGGAALLFAVLFPVVFNSPVALHLMILIYLYALMGMGWNILGGLTGQVSLGHAVYFGIGAYVSSFLVVTFGLSPWLGMIPGVVASVMISLIIGYPCFRLGGHYFAIATICVGEIIHIIFLNWNKVGGAIGILLPIKDTSFVNFQFNTTKVPYYYIILTFLIIVIFLTAWIRRSRLGFYFRSIREDQDAARSIGVNAAFYKMVAMGISAAITSVAGTFYAQYLLFIDPSSVFVLILSVQMCLIAVLGGTSSLWGPIIGAFILIPLSEYSREFLGGSGQGIDLMVYGVLIMVIAAYQPRGLIGLLQAWKWR